VSQAKLIATGDFMSCREISRRDMSCKDSCGRFALNALVAMLISFVGLETLVQAQTESPAGLQGSGLQTSGASTVVIVPSKLRLALTIQAEADDAKKAIKLLQTHKQKVRESLAELKAEETSIYFSSTRLDQNDGIPSNFSSPAVRARILQQANNRGVDPEDMPTIFIAKSVLQADWNLPTADPDAIALLISALKEQATEKDLAGRNIESDISDELRDKVEAIQQMAMQQGYYVDGNSGAGALLVNLVGEVTAEQRTAAIKSAYEEAVAKAQEVAAATSKKLTKVISIRESESSPSNPVQTVQNAYGQVVQTIQAQKSSDRNAVMGDDIDSLRKTIIVTVVHAIE